MDKRKLYYMDGGDKIICMLEEYFIRTDKVIAVRICSYPGMSLNRYAICELFSETNGWIKICEINTKLMRTNLSERDDGNTSPAQYEDFKEDVDRLVEEATFILGG